MMNLKTISTHAFALLVGAGIGLWLGASSKMPEPTVSSEAPPSSREVSPKEGAEKTPAVSTALPTKNSQSTDGTQESRSTGPADDFENALGYSDFDRASELLLELQRSDPASQSTLESAARLLVRQRKWENAKTALQQCLASYPKSAVCLNNLASTEMQVGTKEEQKLAVSKCLVVTPTDPQCRNLAAMTQMSDGNYGEAVKTYEGLIKDNGGHGTQFPAEILFWQYGLALEGAGRFKDASESYYKACRSGFNDACTKYEALKAKL